MRWATIIALSISVAFLLYAIGTHECAHTERSAEVRP